MSNIDLKAQLEKQMLGYLHNEFISVPLKSGPVKY